MDWVKTICVRNPFDPIESREIRSIPYAPGSTVSEYTMQFFPAHPVGMDLVVSVDGFVLEHGDDPVVMPGSSLVFCAVPSGGAKDIFRLLGMLAVMLVGAFVVGPWAAGALFGLESGMKGFTIASAAMGGLFAIGATTAINVLFPVKPPVFEGMGDTFEKSQTYGWVAGSNACVPGGALPTIFGVHRIVPPKVMQYLATEGQKQYLNMLFVLAGHEIDSVSSIRINEQPIENYDEVQTFYTVGINNQTALPYFGDQRADVPIGAKLTTDWTTRQTTSEVDSFGIGLIAPQGLWHAQDDGSIGKNTVYVESQYRKVGDAEWVDWTTSGDFRLEGGVWDREDSTHIFVWWVDKTNKYAAGNDIKMTKSGESPYESTIVSSTYETKLVDSKIMTKGTRIVVTDAIPVWGDYPGARLYYWDSNALVGKQTSPLRWYFEMRDPPEGFAQYEFRWRYSQAPTEGARYGWEIWLDFQQEILKEQLSYVNTAMLVVRALATDQLSGSAPKVDCIVTRSTVPVWTGAAYEDKDATSPAWACWHMLHDDLNGGNVSYDRIVLDDFDDWDDFCTEKSLTCNIYFDTTSTLKKSMDVVGLLGRGQVVQIGSKFTCLVEKPSTAVARFMFGAGNIADGSLQKEWLSNEDRADEIEVTYFDPDDEYQQTTVVVQQVGYDSSDKPPNTLSVIMYGCTDRDMASSYGRFLLNKNKYLTLTGSWEADIESLGCMVGDVVDVGQMLPLWGASGRVVSATDTTVTLDQEVTMSPGSTYIIDIKYAADDSRDSQTITVETTTTTSVLTVPSSWTTVPERFDVYSFGLQSSYLQPYVLLGVQRSGDLKAKLIGIEYVEEVFDDEEVIPPPDIPGPGDVIGLSAVETWTIAPDGSAKSVIDLTWRSAVGMLWYVYLRIHDPDDPQSWSTVGTTTNTSYRIDWNLTLYTTYQVCVSRAGPSSGETALVTITGKGWLPSNITNLTAETTSTGILISWELVLEIDVKEYILKEGTSWDVGDVIYRGLSDNYLWRITVADVYDFWVKVVDTSGNECDVPAYAQHVIENPEVVILSHSFVGNSVLLYWNPSTGDFPIIEYVISYGTSYETSTEIARAKGTTYTTAVTWGGTRRFWVTAVDAAGNESYGASVDVVATVPSVVRDISPQVVHNNVLLRWTEPEEHTLPIASYLLKKGDDLEYAELLGELFATFAAQQEVEAGTYKYWLAAKDTAGNIGVWSSVSVQVTAPIGYILRYNDALDLSDPDDAENYVIVQHSGAMLIPVIRDVTWEDHYENDFWTKPADQIDAGYTLYAHPGAESGYWEQVVDMGVLLPGSKTAIVTDFTNRFGSPEYTITVWTSTNGSDWDSYGDLLEFYSNPFRYVKVRLDVNESS